MKISVVLPTKNSEKTIRKTLQHIITQDHPPCEIIVVDGGSSDNTVKIATSLGVKVAREPPHKGNIPAIGRNYGAKIAEGEILAFLDADCFPEKKWLTKATEAFSDSKVGIYCVIVRDGKGTYLSRAWHYLQMQIEYDFAPTRCIVIRRQAFDAVVGFDENLPAGEDNDFSYRTLQQGYKIIVDKNTIVPHYDDHASNLKGVIHLTKWYRQGELLMRKKWPEKFKKFKTATPFLENHIVPVARAIKDEGPVIALMCIIIKIISIIKHV